MSNIFYEKIFKISNEFCNFYMLINLRITCKANTKNIFIVIVVLVKKNKTFFFAIFYDDLYKTINNKYNKLKNITVRNK